MALHTERIVATPDVYHGAPVIRGTKIMVWLILEYLGKWRCHFDNVLAVYPSLTQENVSVCLAYASKAARERIVPSEVSSAFNLIKTRILVGVSYFDCSWLDFVNYCGYIK